MAKKKVTAVAEELLADFLAQEGYELYHSEFVKEGGDWFLKIFIDRPPVDGEERYINTDDCEKVSRFLSDALDREDVIEQNYYLMVSSPGMDRPLLKPAHYRRYIGHEVEVRLYRGKDGTKNITGTLESFDEESGAVTVTEGNGRKWELELSEIAKTRLAVIF